jgi:DNA polymerase-3 subunit delta'
MPEALLSTLRAQDTAKRTLEHALASGRVHHAYLFTGPDGVGKELAAFGLAQALVCERRGGSEQGGLFGGGGGGAGASTDAGAAARACGECSSCLRALPRDAESSPTGSGRPVHPDVVVLERGLYTPQQLGQSGGEKQDISIHQVRALVLARGAFAPHEGRAKVFIVRRAEELSASAANALLKTLEEPGERTHFVLLTSQPDALLPTILSRTLRLRFAPLPDEVVRELLEARGIAPDRAREVARLAAGSVETGALLADPDESAARERFVRGALEAAASSAVEPTLALADDAKKEKGVLPARVAALASALADRAAESARAGRPDAEALATRGRFALAALEHLAGNGNPQLVVEAMLTRMRGV